MDTREKLAAALWKEEARPGTPSVYAGRDPEAFQVQSDETRAKWLRFADAAIAALAPSTDAPAGMLAEARAIIFALVDDEPCRRDHHGYCQTHYLEEECSVQKGRDFLARIKEADHG